MKFFVVIIAYFATTLADVSHLFNHDGYNYDRPQLINRPDFPIIQPSPLPTIEYLPPSSPQASQFPNFIEQVTSRPPQPFPYVSPAPPIISNIPSFPVSSPLQPTFPAPSQAPEYLPPPVQPVSIQHPTFIQQPIQVPEPIRSVQPIRIPEEAPPLEPFPAPVPVYRQQTQAIPLSRPTFIQSIPNQEYLPPPPPPPPQQPSIQNLVQPAPIFFKSQPTQFAIPTPAPIPQFVAPSPQPVIQDFVQPLQPNIITSQLQPDGYNYDVPNTSFFS